MNNNLNNNMTNAPAQAFKIEEGFAVHDSANTNVGTVRAFRFSDNDPRTSVAETASPSVTETRPASILGGVIDVFADDTDMPQELRDSLLLNGFIRIDQGMFSSDVFATMDQIARVTDDTVFLNVHKDELMVR